MRGRKSRADKLCSALLILAFLSFIFVLKMEQATQIILGATFSSSFYYFNFLKTFLLTSIGMKVTTSSHTSEMFILLVHSKRTSEQLLISICIEAFNGRSNKYGNN